MTHETNTPNNSHHDHLPLNHGVYAAVTDALKNSNVEKYVSVKGPLTIDQLPEQIRTSEAFQEFVRAYDWPSHLNAGDIDPAPEFETDEEFWHACFDKTDPRFLFNFSGWLTTQPTDEFSYEHMYSLTPALHRAYVVAPEFFGALRIALCTAHDQYRMQHRENLSDVVVEHPELVGSTHVAYQLLSRLLVNSDERHTIAKAFNRHVDANETPDITSALNYMRK